MILAVGPNQRPYTFGVKNERKVEILAAMESFSPTAVAEGPARDLVTREDVGENPDVGYRYGDLLWTGEQMYNFEKHDLLLNPDFCDSILALRAEQASEN